MSVRNPGCLSDGRSGTVVEVLNRLPKEEKGRSTRKEDGEGRKGGVKAKLEGSEDGD